MTEYKKQRHDVQPPRSKCDASPVAHVDPIVRAVNTIIYGVVVHCATLHFIAPSPANTCELDAHAFWPITLLLLHEYWVYLQHSNVLGNPLCQRLDRQYGIALLRSNQHWAIAGTLSAYWCREMLSMFLCLPFLASSDSAISKYLILYSLIYHTIKSRGVRKDAYQRHSTTFGIMRQVIDKFYHHSNTETTVTFVRLFLQGSDTFIHAMILKDLLLRYDATALPLVTSSMSQLFIVWVLHAAMNQYFRCSTATLMVQGWNAITAHTSTMTTALDDISAASTCDTRSDASISSTDSDDDEFIVRVLLRPGRVSNKLKGHQGAASGGVDTAVRIETILTIVATVHIVGLGDVPLRGLLMRHAGSMHNVVLAIPFAWLLYNILYSVTYVALRSDYSRGGKSSNRSSSSRSLLSPSRKLSIITAIDVLVLTTMITTPTTTTTLSLTPMSDDGTTALHRMRLLLAAGLVAKSFLKASKWQAPKAFWIAFNFTEMAAKLVLCRWLPRQQQLDKQHQDAFALIGAIVCMVHFVHTLSYTSSSSAVATFKPSSEASSSSSKGNTKAPDMVFLGHPAELGDCWALWLIPYALDTRWKQPWWSIVLWPVHWAIGYYTCNYRRKLFGDGASFFNCDDVRYETVHAQTWTAAHFGRHFFTSKRAVQANIEATARHANDTGVKVLCLGALNKAESINGGGVGVVRALGPKRKVSIIHGNHLTAAAVVETTHQVFGSIHEPTNAERRVKLFLTGASSKVGWAVARALKDKYGYDVLCHSTDQSRRDIFEKNGFAAASTLEEGMAFSKYWIVGKYDQQVANLIPHGAVAIVFAVPHPLHTRHDVRVIEAGTMHIDLSRLDRPRRFTNKLKEEEMFACHAAGIVAADRLKKKRYLDENGRVDEVGPVDPVVMETWLEDAKRMGFRVPAFEPLTRQQQQPTSQDNPPIVVIGAGPSGLAAAACIKRHCSSNSNDKIGDGIASKPNIVILESRMEGFGSWDQHFSGLVVTSQRKWCSLPGFACPQTKQTSEVISGTDYIQYLQSYAQRYDLDIQRGARVTKVRKGDTQTAWYVEYTTSDDSTVHTLPACAVIDASGKHCIPRRDTTDGLVSKLQNVKHLHSSDIRDWTAFDNKRICIVGFGNSAGDICSTLLSQRRAPIHIAARTVPPVFPRRKGVLRVDTIASYVRRLPVGQDLVNKWLWRYVLRDSQICDAAFPQALPRWSRVDGRVPVIDKHGLLTRGFETGALVGHGPIALVEAGGRIRFENDDAAVPIDVVILATGYHSNPVSGRHRDELNGLYHIGFDNDRYLPLKSIGEQAERVSKDVVHRLMGKHRK